MSLCQLIQSPVLAQLGLVMLKTTSEELACPREDLSVARKDELRKLLLEQVPTVLGLLTGEAFTAASAASFIKDGRRVTPSLRRRRVLGSDLSPGILETYWDKHSIIASTPPPSPTSGESGESVGTCTCKPGLPAMR